MEFESLDMTEWSQDQYDEPAEPGYFDDPGQFPDGV